MTTAEEDVIRAECEEWASGMHYPLTDETQKALRERVCANPEAWWRILQRLIVEAPDEDYVWKLSFAPLRMTLECGDDALFGEAVMLAKSNTRMASALIDGFPGNKDENLINLLGRDYVGRTYLRGRTDPFGFWAWLLVEQLVRADSEAAWTMILDLIERAPDDETLGYVAAGPLEDFIMFNASEFIDRVEAAAAIHIRFKEALAGVWINRLPPDLFDRVEAAAGVALDRPDSI